MTRAGEQAREQMERWARGRKPWGRGLLLLVLGLIFWRYLTEPSYQSIFNGLNLVIHEAGHAAFSYFGEWLSVAGGTVFQLGIPLVVGSMFYRQGDAFAVAVALFWVGTNAVEVGVYAADARARALPLVSPSTTEPIHDWYYMLARAGLLRFDLLLGGLLRTGGLAAMGLALATGGWLVRIMARKAAPG